MKSKQGVCSSSLKNQAGWTIYLACNAKLSVVRENANIVKVDVVHHDFIGIFEPTKEAPVFRSREYFALAICFWNQPCTPPGSRGSILVVHQLMLHKSNVHMQQCWLCRALVSCDWRLNRRSSRPYIIISISYNASANVTSWLWILIFLASRLKVIEH